MDLPLSTHLKSLYLANTIEIFVGAISRVDLEEFQLSTMLQNSVGHKY